jgi:hypothetical protein
MVTLRSVAVHRVMVVRKRMTRPILTINSKIVEERILRGDQQDRVLASYTTLCYIGHSVSDLLCHLRKTCSTYSIYTSDILWTHPHIMPT